MSRQSQQLKNFIGKHCVALPGAKCLYSDFSRRFLFSLPAGERAAWTRRDVGEALDEIGVERGRSTGGVCLANLAMPTYRFVVADGQLVRAPL